MEHSDFKLVELVCLAMKQEAANLQISGSSQQYKVTYQVYFDQNKVRIANIPGRLKVKGLDQLKNTDIANAKLVRKATGLFLYITTYVENIDDFEPNTSIGIDMGLKDSFTFLDGRKIKTVLKETERLKGLQYKLSRQKRVRSTVLKLEN